MDLKANEVLAVRFRLHADKSSRALPHFHGPAGPALG